jgi:carbonyl reductase 1
LKATQASLPLIRPGGRLVNVTSTAGSLGKFSSSLASRFRAATAVNQVTNLMDEFTTSVAAGTEKSDGWPSSAYAASKAGATAMTMVIGREESKKGNSVLVNACCPGWVKVSVQLSV